MHFSSVYQGTVSHLFGIHEIIEVFSDFVMFVFVHVCVCDYDLLGRGTNQT